MWIEKISFGVLRVMTPMGPRYIRPSLFQRIYLLWIFRHFHMLPLQVLSRRQQNWIDMLCTQHRFVPMPPSAELDGSPVLGTVEWRPRKEASESAANPPAAIAGLAESARQRT